MLATADNTVVLLVSVFGTGMSAMAATVAFLYRGQVKALVDQITHLVHACEELEKRNDICEEDRRNQWFYISRQEGAPSPREFRETIRMQRKKWEEESGNEEWDADMRVPRLSFGKTRHTSLGRKARKGEA